MAAQCLVRARRPPRSRRAVAILAAAAFEVAEHLRKYPPGPERLVFTGPAGGAVRSPHFGRLLWRLATKAVGLEGFRFGNPRHTAASLAIATGANAMLVAARLGHASTRMVERHCVSLFEGIDREIGDRLDSMRTNARAETARMHPTDTARDTGYGRGTDGAEVIALPAP